MRTGSSYILVVMIAASAAFAQAPPSEPHRDLITSPPQAQQIIQSPSQAQSGERLDQQSPPINPRHPDPQGNNKSGLGFDEIKITDAIIAAFTVFLVIGTVLLWDATRKLWRSAENQLAEFHTSLTDNRASAERQAADMQRSIEAAEITAKAAANSAEIARETMDKDHDRRKKQSTVKYWTTTRSVYYRNYSSLSEIHNPTNDRAFKSSDNGRLLREYLGMLEAYAIGIEAELFDFNTAKTLSGGFIKRLRERYSQYIVAENKRTDGRAYAALLNLKKKLA